jgi:hypothetical protein
MDFFDFVSFPSKSDWTSIMNEFPIVRQISIKVNLSLKEDSISDIADALIKPGDFSNWQTRLVNKLGKLRFSYVLLIYYSKNLPDKNWIKHNDDGRTNFFPEFEDVDFYKKFMFDYFTENFYYHYFSTIDIISYLLNIYYDLDIKEGMAFSKNVQAKVPDEELRKTINTFLLETKDARNGRNSLTHKFPFNEVDMTSKRVDNVFYGGTYNYRPACETIKEIQQIIVELEKMLRAIEDKMKNVA